jgi:hypothetical protein
VVETLSEVELPEELPAVWADMSEFDETGDNFEEFDEEDFDDEFDDDFEEALEDEIDADDIDVTEEDLKELDDEDVEIGEMDEDDDGFGAEPAAPAADEEEGFEE